MMPTCHSAKNATDDKTMTLLNRKGKLKCIGTAKTIKIKTDLFLVSRQGGHFVIIVKESYKMSEA